MVHGLRDTAWALLPVARYLAPGYRVLLPELRGHGESSTSDAYAMPNFLLDLRAVLDALATPPCALFGHSLGGHIVTKFAALFPELVNAVIVAEGLGPPRRPHEGDAAREVARYRGLLEARLGHTGRGKPIAGLDDVVARLCRNNPRLDPNQAERLAPHLIRDSDNGPVWAFDARASAVFLGTSREQDAKFWSRIEAPTCIVTGVLAHEYWGREMPDAEFTGHFAEGEMEQRLQSFRNHQHHWFEHSGHMVHYDEPDRLGELCKTFLETHHV
jgi:pimeloyl-ACP methyl ester carboxylesterase